MQRKKLSDQVKEHAKEGDQGKSNKITPYYISSGSTLLDLAISGGVRKYGGLPGGILVEIFGPSGCVDKNTEFLSPSGWIKISKWKNEKVLQFHRENGTASFVYPLRYIKQPAKILNRIRTKYGIDQCLSDNHNFVYYLPKGKKWYEKPFYLIKKQQEKSKYGFSGKIETIFTPLINTKLSLTAEELRVQVMFMADGSYSKRDKKGELNLKKKRKVNRAKQLLKAANIQFKCWNMQNGYTRFNFHPPLKDKYFDKKYYQCSVEQLNIICDEIFYWDAEFGKKRYQTTIKESKDFIQYALASVGYRSTVYEHWYRKNKICYNILATKQHLVGLGTTKIKNYKTKDGFEYCFTVPTGCLILRRNDKIFITGNCGKTVLLCEIAGSVQRKGGDVMFHDPEARLNNQFAQLFDLDTAAMTYNMPNTVSEVFEPVRSWEVTYPDKINGVFTDSLAALSTEMEMEDKDKMGMRRAKEFSEQLRKTCRILKEKNYLLVCSNQVRVNTDAGMYESKYTTTGGIAIGFYSSVRLRCSNPQKIKKEKTLSSGVKISKVIGVETTIDVFKNSIDKPYRTAKVPIIFSYGIDDIRQNLIFLKEYTKTTAYCIGEEKLAKSLDDSCLLVEKEGLQKKLKTTVIELWNEIENNFQQDRQPKHIRE